MTPSSNPPCPPLPGAIDVHTHYVPRHFPAAIGDGHGELWPSMSGHSCGHGVLSFGKGAGKSLSSSCWDLDVRTTDMVSEAMGAQVLSPMPDLFGYGLAPRLGLDLCRFVNDEIAAAVAAHPGLFYGLGMVPLQSPELAVEELERCVRQLGLQGIEVGTNILGVPIGDERFHPLFHQAERLGAAIFVHPVAPVGAQMIIGPKALHPVIGFSTESTLGVASLITGGVLDAFPKLRIGSSHCGGGLGLLMPRLQHAWHNAPAVRDAIPNSPMETARRLYYDILTLDAAALRYAMGVFGTDRLMVGSDYPFPMGDRQVVQTLRQACDDPAVRGRILRDNAMEFLFG